MVLTFECLPTHGADVFSFVAVSQLVFGQGRGVPEDLGAYLQKMNKKLSKLGARFQLLVYIV